LSDGREAAGSPTEVADGTGAPAAPLDELRATFPDASFSTFAPSNGPAQEIAEVPADGIVAFVRSARELGFRMFVDLCAVDYLRRTPRFEVVITLLSLEHRQRLRIKVPVPAEQPSMSSITSVFPGANFYEREAYDLFGIEFAGHPDLSRILLPDDWEGHPLRKDYAVGSVPVQFKGAHKAK
jgi:NADH-quinone oxidoreductase subunit C